MKLYSKTVGQEIDVDTMEKLEDGKTIMVITHASLMDVIYNQLNLCKDPECIQLEAIRPNAPYPVYKCIIWDKERNRCAVGVGSGNPETLSDGIAANYADESASNRAFDRAALAYLQFNKKQLSEEEVGIFISTDLIAGLDPQDMEDEEDEMIQEPVPEIKQAPITQTTESNNFDGAINPPVEEVPTQEVQQKEETNEEVSVADTVESPDADVAAAGARIITFGKFSRTPMTAAEICEKTPEFVGQVAKIKEPSESIRDDVNAILTYAKAKGIL